MATYAKVEATMRRKRNPVVKFEMRGDEKEQLKKHAKRHNRTVSNLMRYLAIFELKKGKK